MRQLVLGLALLLQLVAVDGVTVAWAGDKDGPKARMDPNFPALNNSGQPIPPSYPIQPRAFPQPRRPVIVCDPYGQCWQQMPRYGGPGKGSNGPDGQPRPRWRDPHPDWFDD